MAKNLIIYYSRKGENYWNGGFKDLKKGNTEIVAEYIQKAVGGDLFEVETVREYSASYMTCIEEAKDELRQKARPELKRYLDDISDYDNVVGHLPHGYLHPAGKAGLERQEGYGRHDPRGQRPWRQRAFPEGDL